MNRLAELFYKSGEPYAAGLFEEPERSIFYRHTLAHARYLAAMKPCTGHITLSVNYQSVAFIYNTGTKFTKLFCHCLYTVCFLFTADINICKDGFTINKTGHNSKSADSVRECGHFYK